MFQLEHLVGPSLAALPFVFGFTDDETARNFYIGVGLIVFVLGFITDYQAVERDRKLEDTNQH